MTEPPGREPAIDGRTVRTAESDRRTRWGSGGWLLYAALAGACVLAVWIPIALFEIRPVRVLGVWIVLGGYLGLAWLTPGVLAGLAVARAARERRTPRPNLVGAVAGCVIGVACLLALSAWLATAERRWEEETTPKRSPRVTIAPEELVRATAERPILDLHCHPISDGSYFCAVTYDGPACQLFSVVGDEATPLPLVSDGATARKTTRGVRCSTGP
jgi:hypothetical protein